MAGGDIGCLRLGQSSHGGRETTRPGELLAAAAALRNSHEAADIAARSGGECERAEYN